jgi:thiamine-monophosphate kinase
MAVTAPEPLSGEDRLIARFFRPLAQHPGALALTDDAAIVSPPAGCDLVLTTDALVAGVHFFAEDPGDLIAKKSLRVNLSDLAAKGAEPVGYLLSLALPRGVPDDWLAAFAGGLGEDGAAYGCPLLGGDSVHTPAALTISITALGMLPHGTMVRRSSANAGDRLMVTGTIGDAALGLALRLEPDLARRWKLEPRQRSHLLDRYLLPHPRNQLAETVRRYASAGMDVSDGLVGDLGKLCAASGVAADVEVTRMPLSDAARQALMFDPARIETVLTGGDDYELLTSIPPAAVDDFVDAAKQAGVAVTEIGAVKAGGGPVRVLDRDGRPVVFKQTSFSHF